jgi:hypothetical protein
MKNSNPKPEVPKWKLPFLALISPEPLSEQKCFQINAILSGLSLYGCSGLIYKALTNLHIDLSPSSLYIIWTMGFATCSASAFFLRDLKKLFLALTGILLAIPIIAYVPYFSYQIFNSGVGRFSHMPGILSLGLGYSIRLVTDAFPFLETSKMGFNWVGKTGWVGIIIGGVLDLSVMGLMLVWFMKKTG